MSHTAHLGYRASKLIALAALAFIVSSFAATFLDSCCLTYPQMLMTAAAVVLFAALFLIRKCSSVAIALCVGILVSFALSWIRPTSRGLFLQDLYSIRPGMTMAQVRQEMDSYDIRGQGKAARDSWPANRNGDEFYIAYSHSNTSAYNADVGAIVFRRGKVVYTTFSAD